MTFVHEFRHKHPLTFPLGVAVVCCLIVLAGMRIHLGQVSSEAQTELQRMRDIEARHIEYQKLEARVGSGVDLLKTPDVMVSWGVEEIARESTLASRVKDTRSDSMPHGDFVERLVTVTLMGVHRRELVENLGPENPGGFLQRVEAADPAIRTKALLITPNRKDPKLIDAKATFSAYESKASSNP